MIPDNLIFLDLETTGLYPEKDEIIEIGAVKYKEGVKTEYHQLINPQTTHISPVIFNLCQGLSEEELRTAPTFDEIEPELLFFLEDLPVVCHNAEFDGGFLVRVLGNKINNIFLDTLQLFCIFKPQFPAHSIAYITENYSKTEPGLKHRALDDARETAAVTFKLFEELAATDNDIARTAVDYIKVKDNWPWLDYLNKLPYHLKTETIKARTAGKTKKNLKSSFNLKDIKKILKDTKLFGKEFPDYKFKPHQLTLAENIIDSLNDDEALFAEAPTGSGKTLAYLIVASLWAVEKKETIFISTNTKNLQQQIDKDLPRICSVLKIEGLKHIEMKGINNYACKNKIENLFQEECEGLEDKLARLYLYNWMNRTTSGEIDSLSYWFFRHNKKIRHLTNTISCYKEDCLESNCHYEKTCFYKNKVRELYESSICTINHSLLLTWPSSYPPITKLIIDEAHSLEENCFSGFTEEVNSFSLKGLLYQLSRNRKEGYLQYLLFRYKKHSPEADFRKAYDLVFEIIKLIEKISIELSIISIDNQSGYPYREQISATGWEELKTLVKSCSRNMELLASFIENVLKDAVFKDDTFEETYIYRQGRGYHTALRDWSKILSSVLNGEDSDNCRYVEYHQGHWHFRITPLDVSALFFGKVIQNLQSVILTSATLSEKKTYERLAENLGFNKMEEERVRYLPPLEHLFDYENNSVLAILKNSRPYDDPEFDRYMSESVIKLASLVGGRTLVLFTNLQRMRNVTELTRIPLEKKGISLLSTDEGSRHTLIDMFREDRNSVLFGSRALFEGIDVRGPGLSCIIIDKLPYPYPEDPLYKARSIYLETLQKKAFSELSLSLVIRIFRQQFGRLIRSEDDRGFVIVLSQLDSDRNRHRIIRELPPAKVIKAPLDEIIASMKQKFSHWDYKTY